MERRAFLLLFSGLCTLCSCLAHQYYFVNVRKNWTEAQSYCRKNYTDLVTIGNPEEMSRVMNTVNLTGYTGPVWIGLEKGNSWQWQWSLGERRLYSGGQTGFSNWDLSKGAPHTDNGNDNCVGMVDSGKWNDIPCGSKTPTGFFVCYDGRRQNNQSYVFINQNNTNWTEAQRYCREKHTDLVSVRNQTENRLINSLFQQKNWVWIGLYRDYWQWSDQSNSSFRNWAPGRPNMSYGGNEKCAVALITGTLNRTWGNQQCGENHPFICYDDTSLTTQATPTSVYPVTSLNISSNASLTTQATPTSVYPVTSLNISSNTSLTTQATPTSVYPVTSLNISSNASLTTQATPTSVYPVTSLNISSNTSLTTQATPTSVYPVTSLNISSNTSLTTQATPTSMYPVTSLNISSNGVITRVSSTIAVPQQTETMAGEMNTFLNPIIFVTEKKSWNEALRYCRDKNMDLVSVHNADVQEFVVKTVQNATSSYVWLGLRYSCVLNFWFWVSAQSVEYTNWANGNDTGNIGCGTTGAVESSGSYQWVRHPETEELNFICCQCCS